MSGGHYQYAYSHAERFAYDLRLDLDRPELLEGLSGAHIDKLHHISALASYTARLMREAEWLFSGDTGPESFALRVEEIERDKP
jgi:hypothetical protein